MATVTIRNVIAGDTMLQLNVEYDFSMVEGGSNATYVVSISKPEFLYWKDQGNPTGSLEDFIVSKVQPHYEQLKQQRDLAVSLNLVGKQLSW